MEDKKNTHKTTEIRLSDGERSLLASLSNMKETVKTGHMYPNLYSQAAYSMQELAGTRDEILEEIRALVFDSGDFAADALIESIYHELVTTFDPFGDVSEDFDFTRKALSEFANGTYTKIEAARHIRELCRKADRIKELESRIELAKKGVLL
ncbi:hypothetical protein [Bacteroides uniformis]|jgi:hypothetical protein|uniref:hypothetical protein n=1 Tax=Bacteroides uniformis TaxID=820 RepID=UPI0034AE6A74